MSVGKLFQGMSAVQANEKLPYFKKGQYLVEISQCKLTETSGDKNRYPVFVVEAKVLGAMSDDDEAPEEGKHAAMVIVMKGDYPETKQAAIKTFVTSYYGEETETWDDETWEEKIAEEVCEDNTMKGAIYHLQCDEITTKKGNPFTTHLWRKDPSENTIRAFAKNSSYVQALLEPTE
jgi:galactitol-specific phosphotransferase system IIB component